MQFMFIARRRIEAFPEEAFAALLDDEAEAVRVLYAKGVVRAAWTREDVPGGCFLIEAADIDEVRAHLNTAPLIARGMMDMNIIPLRGYRGFGPRR